MPLFNLALKAHFLQYLLNYFSQWHPTHNLGFCIVTKSAKQNMDFLLIESLQLISITQVCFLDLDLPHRPFNVSS